MYRLLQYSYSVLAPKVDARLKNVLTFTLKLSILLFALYFIIDKVGSLETSALGSIQAHISGLSWFAMIPPLLVLCLMPVNWACEAWKWKILAEPIQEISFRHAFQAVLAGLSFGFITPHAIGDYAARVWFLDSKKRHLALGPIFIGRISQFVVTLVFGLFGIYHVLLNKDVAPDIYMVFFITLAAATFTGFLWAKRSVIFRYLKRFELMSVLVQMKDSAYKKTLAIAAVRYAIFSLQFILILYSFDVGLDLSLMFAGVTWVFLVKSILPSFNFLSDLGIREFSALLFFPLFGADELAVITASLALWLINLLFPTLLGLVFTYRLKIIR